MLSLMIRTLVVQALLRSESETKLKNNGKRKLETMLIANFKNEEKDQNTGKVQKNALTG